MSEGAAGVIGELGKESLRFGLGEGSHFGSIRREDWGTMVAGA